MGLTDDDCRQYDALVDAKPAMNIPAIEMASPANVCLQSSFGRRYKNRQFG